MSEALLWVKRALELIPALIDLWEGVSDDDDARQHAAQMELVRQIKIAQVKEDLRDKG